SQVSLNPAELSRLQQSILDLYLDDYIRHWQGLLSDLAVPPLRNLAEGADFLNIASSAGSPLRRALVEVARQTALSRRPEDTATDLAGKAAEMAGGKAAQTFDATGRLAGIVGAAAPAPAAAPEARVDAAFLQLHQFVGEEGAG